MPRRHDIGIDRKHAAEVLRVPVTLAQAAMRAASLHQQGRLDEAARLYREALAVDRNNFDCLYGLGGVLAQQGLFDEAIRLIGRAIKRKPNSTEAHSSLGQILLAVQRPSEAILHYKKVISLRPDHAEAYNNLGVGLWASQRYDEAISHYQKALSLKPDYAQAENNLGLVFAAQHRFDEAVKKFERAIEAKPDYAEAENNLGNALCELGRVEEAIRHYRKVISLKPNHAEAHTILGRALMTAGHLAEGRAAFADALDHVAAFADALEHVPAAAATIHHNLALSKDFEAGDPQLAAMETLLGRSRTLSTNDQAKLHFALGKAYGDLAQHERAFHHLREGNALVRQQIAYDEEKTLRSFDRIRQIFTPELMRQKRDLGNPSTVPIFIIGMPRSGTSLVEQILASHPLVFGAGELDVFADAVAKIGGLEGVSDYPEIAVALSGAQLQALAERYLGGLPPHAVAERVTDKMPANFRFAGLIHLAFPNARIIHIRRDPVDTCFSCYSLLFVGQQHHTYDLAELGRYYRAYERLMAHWRDLLSPEVMLEVQYEELVADLTGQTRRMLAHCDLAWDEACLAFYQTQRSVATASFLQVRRPIYRGSIGRWQPYASMLRPLVDALAD